MERRSKLESQLRFAAGMACLSATFMLSAPGVRIAQASESDSAEFNRFVEFARSEVPAPAQASASEAGVPEGPSCSSKAAHGGPRSSADYSAHLQRAMDQLVAQAGAAPSDVRPLNGRGHNYGQAPLRLDQALLRADLQR